MSTNLDPQTVDGFGDEWRRFDQTGAAEAELDQLFADYFRLFPWSGLPDNATGADFGCGSGRWAVRVAPQVGHLHLVDASPEALAVARRNLAAHANCTFHESSIDHCTISPGSLDFGYSLGVLHHIPDTAAALTACVRLLKPDAPFLLYLYYRFDNRPAWFRLVWRTSELLRGVVSRLPHSARYLASQALATFVYWPLARGAKLVEQLGGPADALPLGQYRDRSFYVMRNDALDRFGTRLEQRFTRGEIAAMMRAAGLDHIEISALPPYWCAVGRKRRAES